MSSTKKPDARFSASKREFLKKAALMGVYIGPIIRTFEMAEITSKPTAPDPKKKLPTSGSAQLRRPAGKTEWA